MKRVFLLIFLPFLIFLSSCSVCDYPDASLFCEEFNKLSPQYSLDINNSFIKSEKNNISYSLFAGNKDNILINLYTKGNDSRIEKRTLTVLSDKIIRDEFLKLSKALISAYTQGKDNPDEIIKELKDKNKDFSSPQYFETTFFRYSYQKNKFGVNLIIENKLLAPAPDTELTLRAEK